MSDNVVVKPVDLADLDVVAAAEAGTVTELLHPGTNRPLVDPDGKPYFIEHKGFDAADIEDLDTRFQNKRIEAASKNKPRDVAMFEAETVAKLCKATIRWYLPPMNGVPTGEYTHELGKKIYSSKPLKWIPEQMIEDAKNRARFFEKVSAS